MSCSGGWSAWVSRHSQDETACLLHVYCTVAVLYVSGCDRARTNVWSYVHHDSCLYTHEHLPPHAHLPGSSLARGLKATRQAHTCLTFPYLLSHMHMYMSCTCLRAGDSVPRALEPRSEVCPCRAWRVRRCAVHRQSPPVSGFATQHSDLSLRVCRVAGRMLCCVNRGWGSRMGWPVSPFPIQAAHFSGAAPAAAACGANDRLLLIMSPRRQWSRHRQ